jgi:hypothetical protein
MVTCVDGANGFSFKQDDEEFTNDDRLKKPFTADSEICASLSSEVSRSPLAGPTGLSHPGLSHHRTRHLCQLGWRPLPSRHTRKPFRLRHPGQECQLHCCRRLRSSSSEAKMHAALRSTGVLAEYRLFTEDASVRTPSHRTCSGNLNRAISEATVLAMTFRRRMLRTGFVW